jgi:polysaccharide deacetylase 2 family uncharacterized protein YibQ
MTNSPDHNGAKPRRHRIAALVAVVVMTIVIAAVAGLLTRVPSLSSGPTPPVALNMPSSGSAAVEPIAPAVPPSVPVPAPLPPPSVTPVPAAPPMTALITPAQPPLQTSPPATPAPVPVSPTMQTPPPATGEQQAWMRFAAPSPVVRDRPRIAIVIDDLGLDRARTARAIGLPAAVTLSFLAYAGNLPQQTAAASKNGHELLVHVPMEPLNARIDMGPNGLATGQPREEVLRRLRWDLDRFNGYVGINNHMGSRFTGDAASMGWVVDELKARGLLFMDSRTIAASLGAKTAATAGVPYVERDVFLDDDQSAPAVQARLHDLEEVARRKGTAVAIGHPHDATLNALITWIASLQQKGIALVPLTEVVKARLGLG